jgi:hypothetical protein
MLARKLQYTITCDYAGCDAAFVFDGVILPAQKEARTAGWAISPQRTFCPQHRIRSQRGGTPKQKPLAKWAARTKWAAAIPDIIADRVAGKTLQQLAEEHGVTRENIRQVLGRADIDDATRRALDAARWPRKAKPPGFKLRPHTVRRWLLECGYRYCSHGKHAVCAATYGKRHSCRECNAAKKRAHYARRHPGVKRREAKTVKRAARALRGDKWRKKRPSRATGYRSDPERHKEARAKVSPERRSEIARMGAAARRKGSP